MNLQLSPDLTIAHLEATLKKGGLLISYADGGLRLEKCDHQTMRRVGGIFRCACGRMLEDVEFFSDSSEELRPCPVCNGTGANPASDNMNWLPCSECNGKKVVQ